MPYNTVSDLFGYGNTESVNSMIVFRHIHYKISVGIGFAGMENRLKFFIFTKSFHLITESKNKRPHFAAYADNFFLPLALLAANTFLPPGVLILALKP